MKDTLEVFINGESQYRVYGKLEDLKRLKDLNYLEVKKLESVETLKSVGITSDTPPYH